MRTSVFDNVKLRGSAARYREWGASLRRSVLEFCDENLILFAAGLLVCLVAAILVAWFQWQATHAEFGLFVTRGH